MDSKGRPPLNPRQLVGFGFVAAMVAAPFLALLYGLAWGLAVLAFALASTAYLALDAARTMPDPALRTRLRMLAAVNGVLGVAALAILVARI